MQPPLDLSAEKALIFRIVHKANLAWLLKHGVPCPNSDLRCADYVEIGNPDLIGRRAQHPLPDPPGGMLSDYVPFYFTPCSPMLMNIKTGYNGVRKREMGDIVVLVTSFKRLRELGVAFAFSDRHAYLRTARFFTDMADLDKIDWPKLCSRTFKVNRDDPASMDSFERYQAEALVHRVLPPEAVLGVGCLDRQTQTEISGVVESHPAKIPVVVRPQWYP